MDILATIAVFKERYVLLSAQLADGCQGRLEIVGVHQLEKTAPLKF